MFISSQIIYCICETTTQVGDQSENTPHFKRSCPWAVSSLGLGLGSNLTCRKFINAINGVSGHLQMYGVEPLTLHPREAGLGIRPRDLAFEVWNHPYQYYRTRQWRKFHKNRKPIEEVGCGDAWMAERTQWQIERQLSLWVSWFFCGYVYIYMYI